MYGLATGNGAVTRKIPLDEIQEPLTDPQVERSPVNGATIVVLVGVGAALVLVGVCASALNNLDLSPTAPVKRPP